MGHAGAIITGEDARAEAKIQALRDAGATIAKTEDYRTLEDQVGEIISLATGSEGDGGATK